MPIIIKNGKVYGDRSVTLSQAEYNALSEVEKNNGTTYYIYDVNGVVTANDVALDGGTVETLAGSVATFESSPATATHEVGDHILWNGQLYTVTAAIAVGETLTVGTNITSTNVGSELTALNAGLTFALYEGAWVRTSSNGLNQVLTETLVLPAGLYIIFGYAPSGTPNCSIGYNGTTIEKGYITADFGSVAYIDELTEQTNVALVSTTSTSLTYSYINRAGIKALKIK